MWRSLVAHTAGGRGVASIAALFRLLAKLRASLHLASFTSTKSCHPDQYKILLARSVFYIGIAKKYEK